MSSSESELTQDVVFDILSNPRRRYVLYYLRTIDGPIQLTDLAEEVAAWENEDPDITEQERKRVYVSLYQTHIPKLHEAGLVEYDKESGAVALATDAKQLDAYLLSSEERIDWQKLYFVLAGASIVLLALTIFNVGWFALVSEAVIGVFIVLAFVVTATAHYISGLRQNQAIPPELQNRK